MNLNDLYQKLSFGELSNLALANEGNGTIKEAAKPRIVNYANEALTRIHTQFLLRENDLVLELYEDVTNYHLIPRFAQNAGSDPVLEARRYIRDLPNEPFLGDVAKVMRVFDQEGYVLPLNDENKPLSVFTPQPLILQVPSPEEGKVLAVQYQALHPKLDKDVPEGVLFVPESLMGALTAFIAYKVFSHMNTQDASAKAQEHLSVYTGICQEVREQDITNQTPSNTYSQFEERGWA